VGLNKFTDVTGSYETNDATIAFNDSANTLPTKDIISTGTFDVWSYVGGTSRRSPSTSTPATAWSTCATT
jgi:hypothetical protein